MTSVLRLVLEAAAGHQFRLDEGSSKVLRFMLSDDRGCDILVKDAAFEIRYGWHPAIHRYFPELAPPVLSALLDWSGLSTTTGSCQATVGPRHVAQVGSFPSWSFGRRIVWIVLAAESLTISIRDGEHVSERCGPTALPEPVDFPRVVVELPSALPCPHCTTSATTYRELSDGALVCSDCGRSFRKDLTLD